MAGYTLEAFLFPTDGVLLAHTIAWPYRTRQISHFIPLLPLHRTVIQYSISQSTFPPDIAAPSHPPLPIHLSGTLTKYKPFLNPSLGLFPYPPHIYPYYPVLSPSPPRDLSLVPVPKQFISRPSQPRAPIASSSQHGNNPDAPHDRRLPLSPSQNVLHLLSPVFP